MSHSIEQWASSLMLQMPRGAAWPTDPNSNLYKYVYGFAPRLEATEVSASTLLTEMRPESTISLLPEWETYLGLPDCKLAGNTFESRRDSVIEKYYRKGGLQAWNIEKLAADLGFNIRVEKIYPHHCLRGCTYPLYEEKYRYVIRITVLNMKLERASCLDGCLTPLVSQPGHRLRCTLSKFKMGGKEYEFVFEENE